MYVSMYVCMYVCVCDNSGVFEPIYIYSTNCFASLFGHDWICRWLGVVKCCDLPDEDSFGPFGRPRVFGGQD